MEDSFFDVQRIQMFCFSMPCSKQMFLQVCCVVYHSFKTALNSMTPF